MENLKTPEKNNISQKIPEGAFYVHKPLGEEGKESIVYKYENGAWWKKGKIINTQIEDKDVVKKLTELYFDNRNKK